MTDIVLTPKQKAKIKRAVKALNDVRAEVERDNECDPNGIQWYLEDSNNLNLMDGMSHDSDQWGEPSRRDAVIDLFCLDKSSGGGW